MDIIIKDLRIQVEKDGPEEYAKEAALRLNTIVEEEHVVKILSKSLDISDKEQFYYNVSLVVRTDDSYINAENFQIYSEKELPDIKTKRIIERPIIIGFGPAGIFAAIELVRLGIRPLIFERGKTIDQRDADVKNFFDMGLLDPGSNIQFGEGGAGTYSDGKIFSRIDNSVYVEKVIDTLIEFGAPEDIRYKAKPHLGTNVLHKIVKNLREHIIDKGGEIRFNSKVTDLIIRNGEVRGVVMNGKEEFSTHVIYLAIGNSARETFEMLYRTGVRLEPNPISVGVRIEHPKETINLLRYGPKYARFSGFSAATYSFNYTDRKAGRGAYTFCMCPGGEVLNASSEQGMLALNGMSFSARSSSFSNAAIVVNCRVEDYNTDHPMAGIRFQEEIESKAFIAGGKKWKAPAQNLMDFLQGRVSGRLNESSYKMGTTPAEMREILPVFVCDTLLKAFKEWEPGYPLFVSESALLLGVETRTSSPVKISRNEIHESANIKNLFPIGEGSGYTGGITSAAADAIKSVELSLKS